MFFHALKHVSVENVTASIAAFKAEQAISNFDFFPFKIWRDGEKIGKTIVLPEQGIVSLSFVMYGLL